MDSGKLQDQGSTAEGKLLTIGDLLRFLQRRRWTILGCLLGFFVLAIAYCAVATRRYASESIIEIKRPDDTLGLNTLVSGSSQMNGEENPLQENVTLATKVAELQSESLALRVVEELNMEQTSDYKPRLTLGSLNPVGWLAGFLSPAAKGDPPGTAFLDSPSRRMLAFKIFESHLKVEVVAGTRLISITYQSPSPELAAQVVNTLTNDLSQYGFETKYKATQRMSSWLADQIDSVRQHAEDMQQQEAALRRDTETYNMGGTNAAGQTLVYSPLLDHLQRTTDTLSQAEANRIVRGAVAQIVKTRNPVLISGLAGSGLGGSGNTSSAESLNLIRDLQNRDAQQQLLISQDEQRLGSANPKLIQERAQLTSIQEAVKAEEDRLAARASNDYEVAAQEEQGARNERDAIMKRADVVNDKVLQYEIVHQEASDARLLYTDLNRRLSEAGVLAGLQSNDMTVVSAGFAQDKPASPRIILILGGAILFGGIIGLMIAGIQDVRDDKVNSVETVESELGIPVYSVMPDFNAPDSLYGYGKYFYGRYGFRKKKDSSAPEAEEGAPHAIHVVSRPDSQYSEAQRVLRTAIMLSRTGTPAKTILITSSTPGEGKSTTSTNLGATFARTGLRTLLVEADLRKPVLARRLGLAPSTDGLSRIITGHLDQDWVVEVPGVPNMWAIPAGQRPPDPYELISSDVMRDLVKRWGERFDLVILDGPPVLPVIDSVMLSEHVDLVLVITRFNRTSIRSLRTTHRLLSRQVRASIGAILNAVAQGSEGYYDYYGYRQNPYKYADNEEGS